MNISKISDAATFETAFSPSSIPFYVNKHLRRMYTGGAPAIAQVVDLFGEPVYKRWITTMVKSIVDFAGLSAKFDISQMGTLADMIRSRYPALKVTEIMHFVYLCQSGEYESFYGNPSGRALLSQLGEYVRKDREQYLAKYRRLDEQEDASIEHTERRLRADGEDRKAVSMRIMDFLASDEYAKAGQWRLDPWAPQMARAFFVDRTLGAFPGDMEYDERRAWAISNGYDPGRNEWKDPAYATI